MAEPFSVRIRVRGYELDPQGHLNQAVYTQYAEHARWELLRAAGVTREGLAGRGVGPALLKLTIRFHRELRADDEVDVGCAFAWGRGKLVELTQALRLPDGTAVAMLTGTVGVIDLASRSLVADPAACFRELAADPAALGLDAA
jgi:acyl-CoA thioester hydrolase